MVPCSGPTFLHVDVEEMQGLSNDAVQAGREWMLADACSGAASHNDEDATENEQMLVLGVPSSSGLLLF